MASPRVKLNVSGARFEFDRKLLETRKFHRVTTMCEEAERKKLPLQFTVDRPSESFAAILTFYQTGELHMPTGVCPAHFKKELEYWGIEHDEMAECCLYRYHSFFDEVDTRQKFLQRTGDQALVLPMLVPVKTGTKVSRFRTRLWSIIDYRENSLIAKVYFIILMAMVILSIVNIAFGTLPDFQRSLTQCELLEYLEHKGDDRLETVKQKFGNPDCSSGNDGSSVDEDEFENWEYLDYDDYYYFYYYEYENDTEPQKVKRPQKKELHMSHMNIKPLVFEIIDYVVVAFFTADLLMRIWSCPSLPAYVTSVVNVIEMCAVAGSYTHILVVHLERQHMYEQTWLTVISFFQVFRALRLFRIVRNVRASKVLAYSLRQNVQDVSLLVVLMLVGISTFAMLFYLIEPREDVDSIPLAWYWTIITMTTVGYGDISPKTAGGRVLAAICACCGVLLLSVSLPLFVNNFLTLYQYSCIGDLLQSKKEQKVKLNGAIHAASLGSHLGSDRALKAEKVKREMTINSVCRELTVEALHKDQKDVAGAH